jgi:shikimate kinase
MRIYLTGFMGAGKTTVGRELAERLGWEFVDLDADVEARAGATVVVAVGGGTFADPAVLEAARAHGFVVFLNPSFATIVARIGGRGKSDRPLFRDEASAIALYRERLASYRRADLTIDVAREEGPREVAARIRLALPERVCST